MKLISFILEITILVTFASKGVTEDYRSYGVVIGPNISVYHVKRNPQWREELEIEKFDGMFTTSTSYNYYNNLRDDEDIYFPRILMITDGDMYMRYNGNIQKMINNLTNYLDYADEYFHKMKRKDDQNIKLNVAGLITTQEISILPLQLQPIRKNPELQAARNRLELNKRNSQTNYYVDAKQSLIEVENWLKFQSYYFRNIEYDFFIYISSWLLAHKVEDYPERIIPAMSMEWKCVSDKNSLETPYNMIVNSVIDNYGYFTGKLISHVTHNPNCS